jgi:hypothetical protein
MAESLNNQQEKRPNIRNALQPNFSNITSQGHILLFFVFQLTAFLLIQNLYKFPLLLIGANPNKCRKSEIIATAVTDNLQVHKSK